jgi:hypothetical protein
MSFAPQRHRQGADHEEREQARQSDGRRHLRFHLRGASAEAQTGRSLSGSIRPDLKEAQ